jgi:VanZ family protein
MPGVPRKFLFFSWDKVVHLLMYFTYAMVLMYDYFRGKEISYRRSFFFIICILIPVFVGTFTEIMQGWFFAPRQTDLFDWISNTTGIFLAWLIFSVINIQRKIK